MKKILYPILMIILMAAFVWMPSGTADLRIRVHFDEVEGDSCSLYYSTDTMDMFSQSQAVYSPIDHDKQQAEFILDAACENHITGLRLDFPDNEQLLCIKSITVSSGGVVKRQYSPCDFFSDQNMAYTNSIYTISLATGKARAYIDTTADDPYVILSDALCQEITNCYSHFRLTKFMICIFILGCYGLARKNIFTENPF